MASKSNNWKKGRGKLGILDQLIGRWEAAVNSPMGKLKCTREFTKILGGNYVQLTATWEFSNKKYEEVAIYGINENTLSFWSFTNDGKKSQGQLADGSDVHPQAICFEAQMPAGIARMIYWPGEADGINWAVESKNKKGWKRFTEHHYKKK